MWNSKEITQRTFYYTSNGRVDFRELIKQMADEFKIRIEMRQIGVRQEAQRMEESDHVVASFVVAAG